MRYRRREQLARGSVFIEFALAFPILMVTFLFAWQVIRLFTYDVLGTYAAFAAARSYAVFRGHDFDQEGATPEWLARDVAAAIMAPYTPMSVSYEMTQRAKDVKIAFPGLGIAAEEFSFGGFDTMRVVETVGEKNFENAIEADGLDVVGAVKDTVLGEIEEQLQEAVFEAIEYAILKIADNIVERIKAANVSAGDLIELSAAGPGVQRAMGVLGLALTDLSDLRDLRVWNALRATRLAVLNFEGSFMVTEYGAGAPRVLRVAHDAMAGAVSEGDAGDQFTLYLREGYEPKGEPRLSATAPGRGAPAEVARVSFTYHVPLWIGFTQYGYLSRTRDESKAPFLTVPIYNASASPIKMSVMGLEAAEAVPEDKDLTATFVENKRKQNEARIEVYGQLDILTNWIKTKFVDAADGWQNSELEPDTQGPLWNRSSGPGRHPLRHGQVYSINRDHHGAFGLSSQSLAESRAAFEKVYDANPPDELYVVEQIFGARKWFDRMNGQIMNAADLRGIDAPPPDIRRTLNAEISYRRSVLQAVEREIGELNSLIAANEREIFRISNILRMPELDAEIQTKQHEIYNWEKEKKPWLEAHERVRGILQNAQGLLDAFANMEVHIFNSLKAFYEATENATKATSDALTSTALDRL